MKSCFKLSRNIKQQIPENLFSYKIYFPKKLCVHVKKLYETVSKYTYGCSIEYSNQRNIQLNLRLHMLNEYAYMLTQIIDKLKCQN